MTARAGRPVIGLEIHVQLNTRSKMFCRCENASGGEPEHAHLPGLPAHPGALPVDQPRRGRARRSPIGLALGSEIAAALAVPPQELLLSRQAQGVPDQPVRRAALRRRSLACDVDGDARRLHPRAPRGGRGQARPRGRRRRDVSPGSTRSVVDFNRCGTPLVEIVTEPDLRSPEQAVRASSAAQEHAADDRRLRLRHGEGLAALRRQRRRCAARASPSFGTKTELKNMNSFKFLGAAWRPRSAARPGLLESGASVRQQTLHYDPQARRAARCCARRRRPTTTATSPSPTSCRSSRSAELIARPARRAARAPRRARAALRRVYGLPPRTRRSTSAPGTNRGLLRAGRGRLGRREGGRQLGAQRVLGAPQRGAREPVRVARAAVRPGRPGGSRERRHARLRGRQAGLRGLVAGERGGDPAAIVEERGLGQIADTGALAAVVDEVVAANAPQAEQFRAGKEALMGFFVGQVMRATGGRAEPQTFKSCCARSSPVADSPFLLTPGPVPGAARGARGPERAAAAPPQQGDSSRPTARCCASSGSCSAPRTTCCCSRPRAPAPSSRRSRTCLGGRSRAVRHRGELRRPLDHDGARRSAPMSSRSSASGASRPTPRASPRRWPTSR